MSTYLASTLGWAALAGPLAPLAQEPLGAPANERASHSQRIHAARLPAAAVGERGIFRAAYAPPGDELQRQPVWHAARDIELRRHVVSIFDMGNVSRPLDLKLTVFRNTDRP